MRMDTIKEKSKEEIIIKNSRFIALLYPIDTIEEVDDFLDQARCEYPKATHYTYAYRLDHLEKSSDDREPGGTAGVPILNVLQKQEMNHILAIVIRYFGGIKLGAGGLVRAYSKAVQMALSSSFKISLFPAQKVLIQTDYGRGRELDYLLRDTPILEKKFMDDITYLVLLEDPKILEGHFSYQVVGDGVIKKER